MQTKPMGRLSARKWGQKAASSLIMTGKIAAAADFCANAQFFGRNKSLPGA
jgi:hypothetical protein